MQAVANGRDLRNMNQFGHATAKRSIIPRKDYRHCADAQIIDLSTGQVLVHGIYNWTRRSPQAETGS